MRKVKAHWFDMDEFYASVAKVLKPGGTLAMFTCSSGYARTPFLFISRPHHVGEESLAG